jgi:phosphoribosylanthranilate isomerase
MTWIKICGTTNIEDALLAVEAGADALGFVFYENSPRRVTPEVVRDIVAELPREIEKVGVFVNESYEFMENMASQIALTGIQLHPDWSGGGKNLGTPQNADLKKYLVVPANSHGSLSITVTAKNPELAKFLDAVFLDSGNSHSPGGTGRNFDWLANVPLADGIHEAGFEFVVAGGLNPHNVTEAIRILKPWGVDVVSGVEASPGKKDPEKVRAFVNAVRQAEKSK